MDINYDITTFFQNILILRRAGVAIFADIIKIVIISLKQLLKTQKKLKGL